jgi:hypothetical protein
LLGCFEKNLTCFRNDGSLCRIDLHLNGSRDFPSEKEYPYQPEDVTCSCIFPKVISTLGVYQIELEVLSSGQEEGIGPHISLPGFAVSSKTNPHYFGFGAHSERTPCIELTADHPMKEFLSSPSLAASF